VRIIGRNEWGARYADGSGPAPIPATELYLHHSTTATFGYEGVRLLETIGNQRFGKGISYTFPVDPDGTVYEGHSVDRKGAHTKGHNTHGRAICLMGDYSTETPPTVMLASVVSLMAYGVGQGWWTADAARNIRGHRDVRATACPGDAAYACLPDIRTAVTRLLAGAQPPEPEPPQEIDTVSTIVKVNESNTLWNCGASRASVTQVEAQFLVGAGLAKYGPDGKPLALPRSVVEIMPEVKRPKKL